MSIVVPVLALIGFGLVFARGTDPGAAKDRDAAEKTLLTNGDLGGTFREVAHRAFARSRAGIRIEDDIAECGATDSAFAKDGQAGVDSILQSQTSTSVQVVAQEVLVVGSPDSATPVLDALVGTARSCVSAALHKSAGGTAISLQLAASPAPALGDRAVAFDGSAAIGRAALGIDILAVQQGRAIGLLMTFDTTGSFHGPKLESAMRTLLDRLAPVFGT